MAPVDSGLFDRLERFYDALPRPWARIEEIGALTLFVREGEGWPYYARPRPGSHTPSAADLVETRRRQRDLGVPEAFEWVHESMPDLLPVARSAGLDVLLAPLLVLDPAALVPDLPIRGAKIRYLDPAAASFAADLGASHAVARLGFGAPAYRAPLEMAENTLVIDGAGPAERDAAEAPSEEAVRHARAMFETGDYITAVAESPDDGILATATGQRVGDVAEIVGVATLPSARNRGYASQLTATLTGRLLATGVDLVLLSAGDDDVARLYTRVGFRRVGTACIASPAAASL
ncbi:putative GCN5-related N-acetyltransferase [Actinoplanes missouriensis 431]|uniref:Putative GCN5-related N-acetyltransferase n=1 Tax=Actinoplanes missouriensis (strain ATCC 14538 / DSM 43046 / CBS 188.64 / JCM 3121 / NBRC 102363 / NCIMB 12654 / NRRL B-3342 / UNCC 431) TaxID=512565 RepID=I0H1A3_ACTM4|nr:GNAT family N-acetyltransferase [Actinoplanes missouriensis]BAL86790.1 putative GCN5-related N-acetyltransferase [Actinoplanes missouriensis 431]